MQELVLATREANRLLSALRRAWLDKSNHSPQRRGIDFPLPTSLKIRRTHYKPQRHGRIVVELSGQQGNTAQQEPPRREYASIQIYPTLAMAEDRFRSLASHTMPATQGPPLLLLPEFQAIANLLPNSPRMKKLKFLLRPKDFQAFLKKHDLPAYETGIQSRKHLEMIRFVPRKRAVFRYQAGEEAFYLKMFTKDGHESAANDLLRIGDLQREHNFSFQVPRLLAHDSKAHIIVMNELPGTQVTKHYASRDMDLWSRCGDGLGTLHKLKNLGGLPQWTAGMEYLAIEKGCQAIVAALPELAPRIDRLTAALRDFFPKMEHFSPRVIHANLFGDQMLDDGTQLGIVDWEDLCLGDPCFDVGRLGAHILSCAVTADFPLDHAQRALVCIEQAHRESLNDNFLSPHRFAWHLIGALLLRAKIRCLRQLPPNWEGEITALVGMAEGIRQGTLGPWRLPSKG